MNDLQTGLLSDRLAQGGNSLGIVPGEIMRGAQIAPKVRLSRRNLNGLLKRSDGILKSVDGAIREPEFIVGGRILGLQLDRLLE